MGIFDGLKTTAAKTKIKGQMLLIDREITQTKYKHGVILYDLLGKRHHHHQPDDAEPTWPLEGLEAAYVAAMEDLEDLFHQRLIIDEKLDALEEQGDARGAASSAGGKAKNAGHWVVETGSSAKLKAKLKYYDREIRVRKEIFGQQVFDELNLMVQEDVPEQADDGIGGALNQAKADVTVLLEKKREKELEIVNLSIP